MSIPAPHFLLYSESHGRNRPGRWRFVLQAADGSVTFEAADCEPALVGERLELLAVVRGLEALDQPSRVTLLTPSKYVNRGMAYGLDEWRRNGWTWECFGQMVPVKNRDLWQRLDRALGFHSISLGGYRFDPSHPAATRSCPPHFTPGTSASHRGGRARRSARGRLIRAVAALWRRICAFGLSLPKLLDEKGWAHNNR